MAENKTKAQLEQELAEAKAEIERLQQRGAVDTDSDAAGEAIADAETQAEAIRQQARDEAAEIIRNAEAAAQKHKTVSVEAKVPTHDEGDDPVTIELFKDNGKYKDPLLVCVNGESVLIQRGMPVQIKKKFFWAIEQSQLQDKNTARLITEEAEAYRTKQREHHDI